MGKKSVQDYQSDGFTVEEKPKKRVKPAKKAPIKTVEVKAEPKIVTKEKLVAVVENQGVLQETQRTNQVMQMAVAEITKTLEKLGEKPKGLRCENIKRNPNGLMTGFDIVVID